jgi:hypothetical protein
MARTSEEQSIAALIERTIDTKVPETFGAYLFLDADPAAEIARSVERAVFLEAFGNTAELLATEYGPYESSSLFVCIVDHRALRPAGAVRLILPTVGGPGLKSLNDIEPTWGEPALVMLDRLGIAVRPGSMWDAASLVVAPAYRSPAATGLVSLGLYQSLVGAAMAAGVNWLCAVLDTVVFRVAQAKFAGPFEPYADDRPYLGSKSSLPVTVNVVGWRSRLAAREPEIHEIIYEGTGIESGIESMMRSVPAGVTTELAERLLNRPGTPAISRRTREELPTHGGSRAERAR